MPCEFSVRHVAQSAEHSAFNRRVMGQFPSVSYHEGSSIGGASALGAGGCESSLVASMEQKHL